MTGLAHEGSDLADVSELLLPPPRSLPGEMAKPQRKRPRRRAGVVPSTGHPHEYPVTAVKTDRADLTCFTCDAPARYRIVSSGALGASCCGKHKGMHLARARKAWVANREPSREAGDLR